MTAARKRKVVGDYEGSELVAGMESRYQFKHRFRRSIVEVTGRLVSHQDLGPCYQGTGQRNSLLLTAGKFSGSVMAAIGQPDLSQPVHGFRFSSPPINSSHHERHRDVFLGRKLRQQIVKLPHEANFAVTKFGCRIFRQRAETEVGEVYLTSRRPIKSSEQVKQGTFSGTRFTNNGQHLPFLYLEGQIVKEH